MKLSTFVEKLEAIAPLMRNEPMSRHTTFHIGGPADFLAVTEELGQLKQLLRLAKEYEVPYLLLGAGSNVLVSDLGIRGLVVMNRARQFKVLQPEHGAEGITLVWAESGTPLARLAYQTVGLGLEGLEWAVGIPGTVGGAVVYNAGAYGGTTGQVLHAIQVVSPDGNISRIEAEKMSLGYRESLLKRGFKGTDTSPIILEVELSLRPGKIAELESRVAEYKAHRRQTQPHQPSAGSVFKNSPEHPAGWLIEQVGLKGYRLGQAQISPKHANFIVNLDNATAVEVERLIALAREKVRERFGLDLELEIEIVGERV